MSVASATNHQLERLVESVGPIVVKEVRQGLRAKVFAIFFGTLLVVCLSMALVAVAEAADSAGISHGQDFFGGYLTALGAVTFFVIPLVAFRSMLRELEDETWVLLTLTGLGAVSIVRGKWVSAMSQALLFGSACAPFVLFSYFLNGIDILQIVTGLLLSCGWSALLTAVGIAIATQAHSKLGRTVAHFVVLGLLGLGTVAGITFAWVLAGEGGRLATNDAFRNFALTVGLFSWGLTWLMLEGEAAGLALPSEPASRGPRVAFTIIGLLALLHGLVLFVLEKGRATDAMGGQVVTSFFLTIAAAFCISERDGWPRQAASGGWLKPGALRSYGLGLGMLFASGALWLFLYSRQHGSEKAFRAIIAAFAYPALYLSLAVVFGRLSPLQRFGEPVATRVAFLGAVAIGVGASLGLSIAVEGRADGKLVNALNPIVGMVNFVDRSNSQLDAALVLLGGAALLAVFLATLVLVGRDKVRSA